MKIVLFTGFSASGKSTIASQAGKELEVPVVNLHDLVRKIARNSGFRKTREWVSGVGLAQALKVSRKALTEAIEKERNSRGIIIDEVLDPETLASLKRRFQEDDFTIVYIGASRRERRRRMLERLEQEEPSVAAQEVRTFDSMKEKVGIRKIIEEADFEIENYGNLNEITGQLAEKLRQEIFGEINISREREK